MSAEVEFFHDHVSYLEIEGVPVRVMEVDVRDVAREATWRHGANEVVSVAMAQALAAAALLGGHIKGDEKLTLQYAGNGNLGTLLADCDAEGDLRVTVHYPDAVAAGATLAEQVSRVLGQGTLYVIKSTRQRELYRGTAPFSHTDLAGALEIYLEVSEQVPSLSWIVVRLEDRQIARARGLLVQLLGGGDRAWFAQLKKTVDAAAVRQALEAGEATDTLLELIFPGLPTKEISVLPLRFRCTCSQERVAAMLLALGQDELQEMLEQDGKADVSCDFCRTTYHFGVPELRGLLSLLRKSGGGPGNAEA